MATYIYCTKMIFDRLRIKHILKNKVYLVPARMVLRHQN